MKASYLSLISLILGTFLVTASLKQGVNASRNIIPRSVLFGNPEKSATRISPDGAFISYLANGITDETRKVKNIWIMPAEGGCERQVTFDTNKGIHHYYWRFNSEEIFYMQDVDGDENWQIFGINLSSQKVKEYTPPGSYAYTLKYSRFFSDRMSIALNDRDPSLLDVYELDLDTGERTRVAKNDGAVKEWLIDNDLYVRGKFVATDTGFALYILENGSWDHHVAWSFEDYNSLDFYGFNRAGTIIYFKDALENDTAELIEYSIKERTRKVILTCPTHDVSSQFLYNIETDMPEAIAVEKERLEWHVLDDSCRKAYETFKKANPGDLYILSRTLDRSKWVVAYHNSNASVKYYLYNDEKDETRLLFSNQPVLDKYILAPMEPISYQTRDGLTVHGYLTLPIGKRTGSVPLVLNVHGGPNVRDMWCYNAEVQWLANRGYVVLQVNYRGSTGYGKQFITACYGEWGGKMHDDLIDAVQWAIDQEIADPNRIAIYGGSYGGYAALCGATLTPDRFKCAVDIVGVSNLISFMETIPPYWDLSRPWYYNMVGHPERDKEKLKERSPVTHVDKIRCPLLIAQGANDPRVKQSESEQIVAALKAKNIPHKYLLYKDEGHGFRRPENRLHFYAEAEKFLAEHLGGVYEE